MSKVLDFLTKVPMGNFAAAPKLKGKSLITYTTRESKTGAYEFDCGTVDPADDEKLAKIISAVLRNPNLPEPLYDSIRTGMNDLYNSMSQQQQLEYEESPEYIAKVLKGWRGEKPEENKRPDLAQHISAILKDERTPEGLYNLLADFISDQSQNVLSEIVDSPEHIAKVICRLPEQ